MFLGWMCSQDECSWGGCVHRMSVLGVDVFTGMSVLGVDVFTG